MALFVFLPVATVGAFGSLSPRNARLDTFRCEELTHIVGVESFGAEKGIASGSLRQQSPGGNALLRGIGKVLDPVRPEIERFHRIGKPQARERSLVFRIGEGFWPRGIGENFAL